MDGAPELRFRFESHERHKGGRLGDGNSENPLLLGMADHLDEYGAGLLARLRLREES